MRVYLSYKGSGKLLPAAIERAVASDFKFVQKKKNFGFDWKLETGKQIYKLQTLENGEILGLVSVLDIPDEYRIEISLLEVVFDQKGSKKTIDRIAGCLIAYCCWLSFENGYFGFVSLIPKTELIKHYHQKYGFEQFGRQLAVELDQANHLIQTYLDYGKQSF